MTWYLWLIVGIVTGLVAAFGGIVLMTYVVMRSPKLQEVFITRTMGALRRHKK